VSELSPVEKEPRIYAYCLYYFILLMMGILGGLFWSYTFGLSLAISGALSAWLGIWFFRKLNDIDYRVALESSGRVG